MAFKFHVRASILYWLALLFVVALAPTAVHGQESAREWRSGWLTPSTTVYNTQQQIEAALEQQHGIPGFPLVVKEVVTGQTSTTIYYWHGVRPPVIGQWGYYDNQFVEPGLASEDAMVSATVSALNDRSNDPKCDINSPYYRKATFVPVGNWSTFFTWNGGIADVEAKDYKATYLAATGSSNCAVYTSTVQVRRSRDVDCPTTDFEWNSSYQGCVNTSDKYSISGTPLVCETCGRVGNPVDVTTGEKFESEPDFDLGWISFTRYFHSGLSTGKGGFGHGWTHSQSGWLDAENAAFGTIGFIRPDGYQLPFRQVGTTATYEAIDGSGDRLIPYNGGWKLDQAGKITTFDAKDRLLEQAFEDGTSNAYAYDVYSRLIKITHSTGRSVEFQYNSTGALDDPRIASITSNGVVLAAYVYNAARRLDSVVYAGGSSRIYHYEDTRFPLNLTGITAEDGQRFSTFTYDAKGRVVSSTHAGNADKVSLVYAPEGGAVVTDALGRLSDYDLTPGGANTKYRKVTGVTDVAGIVDRTYYDETVDFRRRLDTYADRNGVQTKHAYAEAADAVTGALASVHTTTEALGLPQQRVREEHRDVASNRLIMTKAGTRETRYTRNTRLQPAAIVVKDTATGNTRATAMTYCEQADVTAGTCPRVGLVKSVDGPRTDVADTTAYTYYASDDATCATAPTTCPHRKGDLWKVTHVLNQVTETLAYDGAGRPRSVKDANGVITDLEYHPRGWLTASKTRGTNAAAETDDAITRIEYWPTGLVKKVIQPDGAFTSYTYDAAHRLTGVADNAGNKIVYTVDNAGNRTREETRDAFGIKHSLARVFDQLGRMQTQKDAYNHGPSFTYDANGNTDITTDALLRKSDNDYDPLERLSRTLQDVGGINAETKFQYDALDNLTQVTDPKGLNTGYTYNGLGDLTQLVSPDTGTTTYTYDSAGNRKTQTDARPQTATHTYDALSRLTSTTFSSSSYNRAYTYDTTMTACTAGETFGIGRLTKLTDGSGTTQYCYDRFGHLVRKVSTVNGKAFVIRYAYNLAGRLTSVTYPDGAVADYLRDAVGRITEVGIKPAGGVRAVLLNQISYYPYGPRGQWAYGNGRLLRRLHNLRYEAASVLDASGNGLDVGFAYDAPGNVIKLGTAAQAIAAPQITFGYDGLNRLAATKDGPSGTPIETYAYDATGNRTSLTTSAGTSAYAYAATNHRLASVGGLARSYDAAGNTTSIGGTGRSYVYNVMNRLGQVWQNGVMTTSYGYNALGEQVWKRAGGTVDTYTLYDEAGHWLGEYNAAGTMVQQAVWLDDYPVGLIADGNQLHYIEPDHLGTPRVVINVARNVPVWTWDLKGEVFGNSVPNQNPDGDVNSFVFNLRFPGQRYDAASGLNYNYLRDGYDPATGRYSQSDPIGLMAGVSTYGYVSGSPLIWTDMYGLLQWTTNPIVWSPTLVPGLQTHTYPGAGASTVTARSAARTTFDWSILPACACGAAGYSLNEYTVNFTPVVFLRQRYNDFDERRASRRAELDHVRDFTAWIGSARSSAQALEDTMKGQSFASGAECENAARQAMQQLLQAGARQAAIDSHNKWDASGRHTQIIPGP